MTLVTIDDHDHGKTCPFCRFPLKSGVVAEKCDGCGSIHHQDCWADGGGCAVFGCSLNAGSDVSAAQQPQVALAPTPQLAAQPIASSPPAQPAVHAPWPSSPKAPPVAQPPVAPPMTPPVGFPSVNMTSAQFDASILRGRVFGMLAAGAAAGLIILLINLTIRPYDQTVNMLSSEGYVAANSIWTAIATGLIGASLVAWDRTAVGAWKPALTRFGKALPIIAAVAYLPLTLLTYATLKITLNYYLDFTELFGWASALTNGIVVGLVAGGVAGRFGSVSRRAWTWAAGGAAGGAVAGLFQAVSDTAYFGWTFQSFWVIFSFGLMVPAGVLIAENLRRGSWLKNEQGPSSGQEFSVFSPQTRIGSSAECEVFVVNDPGVQLLHAWIEDQTWRRVLHPIEGAALKVEGVDVHESVQLIPGQRFELGDTTFRYCEKQPKFNPVVPAQ